MAMANRTQLIYWDSCVIIAYMNADPGRLPTIEEILQKVARSNGQMKLVTFMIAKVEVAFVALEKDERTIDPAVEKRFDAFWDDDSVIELVELHDEIAKLARTLMRQTIASGRRTLKPFDAIHLATAKSIGVTEFQTYNIKDFEQLSAALGLTVCEPQIDQPALPYS